MFDLVEEILERLSPSHLSMLDTLDVGDLDEESRTYSRELQDCINAVKEIHKSQCARETNSLSELLRAKTQKSTSLLDKYTRQFQQLEITETDKTLDKKIQTYEQQIEVLEKQLSSLQQQTGDIGLEQFFCQINEIHKEIQDHEIKIKALLDKHKCYEGFPASMVEAQHCVTDLKESIMKKQANFECYLYGKK